VQELLFLLLPIAAASGWFAARRGRHEQPASSCAGDTKADYFRGLNHLLNEEPDKAIDAFVKMLEVDSDTVETHLALGNLFRRRGEVERAIRLHQNLIARPALTREQRGQALLELGQDYMRAGLYDRAENLFRELRESRMYVRQALTNLLVIYEKERDWAACLETADQLSSQSSDKLSLQKAHYHCEMALSAKADGRMSDANVALKKALSIERGCVRANHLQARMAAEQGDMSTAIKIMRQAAVQDPEYLPELLPEIVAAFRKLGNLKELREVLAGFASTHTGSGAELLLFDLIRELDGDVAASRYAAERLAHAPSLPLLLCSIDLNATLPPESEEGFLQGLRPHIQSLLEETPVYQCKQCGFAAKTLHWQCPSCRSWSTVKRRRECMPVS
jgi:lipopolysaccharide assembly protein B